MTSALHPLHHTELSTAIAQAMPPAAPWMSCPDCGEPIELSARTMVLQVLCQLEGRSPRHVCLALAAHLGLSAASCSCRTLCRSSIVAATAWLRQRYRALLEFRIDALLAGASIPAGGPNRAWATVTPGFADAVLAPATLAEVEACLSDSLCRRLHAFFEMHAYALSRSPEYAELLRAPFVRQITSAIATYQAITLMRRLSYAGGALSGLTTRYALEMVHA